jgi:hypothetical protein
VERHVELLGQGTTDRLRFLRFGPWRDFAVEQSQITAVPDGGEPVLGSRDVCERHQVHAPALGVTVPQRLDGHRPAGQRLDHLHERHQVQRYSDP